jgi:hypothetical protein
MVDELRQASTLEFWYSDRAPVTLLAASGGAWIGSVRPASKGARVLLTTSFGTELLLLPLSGELLPRIC